MYILKLMSGDKFKITEEEFKQIGATKGAVYIKSVNSWINMATVAAIFPESKADEIEDRRDLQHGRLHDGTRVKRHFGNWVDADNQVPDDKGNYQPVRLDPVYYPEIVIDKVFTEQEYEEIKLLSTEEKKQLLLGNEGIIKRLGQDNGLTKISFK